MKTFITFSFQETTGVKDRVIQFFYIILCMLVKYSLFVFFFRRQQVKDRILQYLIPYIQSNWIREDRCFNPTAWSVHGMETRTNNDTEGWHNGLNHKGIKPTFYQLLERLGKKMLEAKAHIWQTAEDVSTRKTTKDYLVKQQFLSKQWALLKQKKISARKLLRIICAYDQENFEATV